MKAKLAILDKIAKGYTQRSLAEEYGVGKATVSDLKKSWCWRSAELPAGAR
jgi:transposase